MAESSKKDVIPPMPQSSPFWLGPWRVQPDTNEISSRQETKKLEHIVMRLLVFLAQNPRQDLTKESILQGVWGEGSHNEEVLTVAISSLRKALGDPARNPTFIKTLHRFGYRFLVEPRPLNTQTAGIRKAFSRIADRVGPRFLVVAGLIALLLTVILVQVAVELIAVLSSPW